MILFENVSSVIRINGLTLSYLVQCYMYLDHKLSLAFELKFQPMLYICSTFQASRLICRKLIQTYPLLQIKHSNVCDGIPELPGIRWNWEFLGRTLYMGYMLFYLNFS